MPIVKIIIAPELQESFQEKSSLLKNALPVLIDSHFSPKPGTQQIMVIPALLALEGCSILIEIFHRHSLLRTADIRQSFVDDINEFFSSHFNSSVRVRAIGIEPTHIAAQDKFMESSHDNGI